MNKAFTKESDAADDDDDGPSLPALPAGTRNYITPAGYARLRAEFMQLIDVERPKMVETVSWAAKNGDRSENGDYLYGKKRLREIDRRLRFLTKRLDIAEVVVVTARNRKESRGGHMRDDFPKRDDDEYMKHTMAYLSGDAGSSHSDDHIRLDWKPVVFTKNEAGELRYPPLERKY